VILHSKAKIKHIRIITSSDFVRIHQAAPSSPASTSAPPGRRPDELRPGQGKDTGQVAERLIAAPRNLRRRREFPLRFEAEDAKAFAVEKPEDAGKGLSFAVVDDDMIIQELVKTVFASINAQVTAFNDGRNSLKRSRRARSTTWCSWTW
jgi:hypothetical protein